MARRSYGTGSLWVRTDRHGTEHWYAQWREHDRQIKRCIGPRRQPGSREGLTRRQAEQALRTLRDTESTPRVPQSLLDLRGLGERYLADLERRGRKPSTVLAVRSTLNTHLAPFFHGRSAQSIREQDINDLITKLRHDKLAPKSIRNYLGTLSAILRYGQKHRLIGENPAEHVELPEKQSYSQDIRFLEPVEVDALVRCARPGLYEQLDRAMFLTAAMTGLRQGELIALRWRDVDWPAQRVRVRRNYVRGQFGTPKSRRSERSIPMADQVAAELEHLFQASRQQADDDLVFADPLTGGPLERAGVLRRYRQALKAAKLDERLRFHDLRHTFGTRMAAAGVPLRTVQEWMGHRDSATTQIYADYAPSSREAEMIAGAFKREPVAPFVAPRNDI